MPGFQKSELAINCWNIYGLFNNRDGHRYNKLALPELVEHVSQYKLFGLVESHHTADDISQLAILNFKCFQVCRKKLSKGRKSGGICVFVHDSISSGVKKIPASGSESIMIKLDKDFFGLDRDIVVCFAYCVPTGSSYQIRTQFDPFEDLEQKLGSVKDNCDIITMGDLNARPGTKADYIPAEDNTSVPVLGRLCGTDTQAARPRSNMDCNTNSYGDKLIELCKSVPLRICNGRKIGDILGSYTCYKRYGQSTVDYCLASPRIYNLISTFVINELFPDLSDHCSVTVKVKTKYLSQFCNLQKFNLLEKPKRVKWDSDLSVRFENNIQSEKSRKFLYEFTKRSLTSQCSIDKAMSDISNFLVSAVEQTEGQANSFPSHITPKKTTCNWKFKSRAKKYSFPKWHDKTCMEIRRQLRITSKILRKNPQNPFLKAKLLSESKDYSRVRKQKQKDFVNNLFLELDQLHRSNPKGYMNIINSIRDGSFDKAVQNDTDHVSPDKWREHFLNLLGPPIETSQQEKDMTDYISSNCDLFSSKLDSPFSLKELSTAVKGLKNNKSPSFDRVTNEMIKVSHPVVRKQILHIFNAVLLSGNVPCGWKDNILTPIHKSGSVDDPDNYRGIAVGSCVSNLFSKLLHIRLETKVNTEHLISKQQGSGKKGSRTSDHLLVFKFIIDKYVNNLGGRLFTCFVDLRKCYDTIPRNLLFYKLLNNYSIGGSFLKVIREMYAQNQLFVKVSNGLCQPFKTTKGVLQGSVNSPLLFNIFVDNITNIFDESCDPVSIDNTPQSCLLWSDDLVLFSTTAKGLQSSIDKMGIFYSSLGLDISLKKLKL